MSEQKLQIARASGLKELLKAPSIDGRIKEVLRERAPQFVTSLIAIGDGMKDVDAISIVASAMTAAALDLPIDKNLGFAWIVPYKAQGVKVAQFQLGYKGIVQLALRSGQYARMNARAVNAEAFGGYDEVGEPKIDWSKIDDTKPIAGYCVAWKLVNGFTKVCYWSKERVEEHAKRYSQAFRGGRNTPWTTNFDSMALKTVLKNELSHWGILSIEMRRAISEDQGIRKDLDSPIAYPDTLAEFPAIEAQSSAVNGDDGDLGPVQEAKQPAKVAPAAGAEQERANPPTGAKESNPQEALEAVVLGEGHTFDDYRTLGNQLGWFDGMQPDSWGGFTEVPTALAKGHVAARQSVLKGLKGLKK